MKNSFIALTLLLFELNGSYAHSIPIKKGHKNVDPYSDVYEIRNEQRPVKFVNPRLDEKMREIVYYHVVEKPCNEDTAETERPFTNAHGYPFLEEFVHKDSNQAASELALQTMLTDDAFPEPSEKVERRKRDVTHQVIPEAPVIPATRYESFPAYLRELISTEQPETLAQDLKSTREETMPGTHGPTSETPELETNINCEVTLHRDDVSSKIIPRDEDGRLKKTKTYGMRLKSGQGYVWNDLFGLDEPKDDIKTTDGENEHLTKPKIDVRVAKNDIQLENTVKTTPESVKYDIENVIKNTDQINEKMAKARETITARLEKILENLDQQKNINTEEERDKNSVNVEKEDTMVNPNKEVFSDFQEMPRTYGMRLINGQGYVWNDIFTNPGLTYRIGDPENLTDPIAPESENAATQTLQTNTEEENENVNSDMDDIFVHIAKFKQTTPAPDVKEDMAIKRHKDKDTHKVIEELLQSDEFWTLVVEWSEMYMDIMAKYIKKTVKSEVKKELEAHLSNIEKDHEKPDELNNVSIGEEEVYLENTSLEPERDTDPKNLTKHELIIKKDGFVIDGIEFPFISNYKERKDSDKGETLKRRKVNKKKPAEITTETANLDSKPSVDTNDILNGKNHTGLINVEHVYGNNVGNEKVTNVFVFYPNEALDKVLEELKPIAGENGVILIKPEKYEDKTEEPTNLETGKEELAGPETGKEAEKEKEESIKPDLTDAENADKIDQKPGKEELAGPETGKEAEKEKEESIKPELTDIANADKIDQKPEEEETKPGTDENEEKEDSKEKTDDVELDARRFR